MVDGDELERTAHDLSDSEPLRFGARAGLVAYGLIHLLIAWLAIRVATGSGGRADQTGALQTIAAQPFGRVLLWLVVAGFAAVVVWRLREAIWGVAGGTGTDRLRKRLFALGQVLLFTVLGALTVRVALTSTGGTGGQGVTAALLRMPGGKAIVVAVGVGVVVSGVVMAVRGWQLMFAEDSDLYRAGPLMQRWLQNLGRVGVLAKAVSVAAIGVLIAAAALTAQPAKAQGLDAALKALAAQPFGPILLIVVALGMAGYGLYQLFDARYHRV